jgi:hypothetical protein
MRVVLALVLLFGSSQAAAQTAAHRGQKLRPYAPPQLEPEPQLAPSDVRVVEIVPPDDDWDANVLARPYFSSPMVGQVLRGARIAVRGEVQVNGSRSCAAQLYLALEPFGFICASQARATSLPPTTEPVLQVPLGSNMPYTYVMVAVEEGSFVPMWRNLDALQAHEEPERQLARGDSIAVRPAVVSVEDENYYVAIDGRVVPVRGTFSLKNLSDWQGVPIDAQTHLPFGWVTPKNASVYDAPGGVKLEPIARRTRIDILEEQQIGKTRWLRVGEGRWIKADQINEVRKVERLASTLGNRQWFDVDLGEQVVVAYRDDKPEYATLISSGREPNHTPRGDYPIWGKVTAITMKSQEYDDKPYYVDRVPWVLFFQAHNALHGAYWHDVFGVVKSHGCANLAPKDARYLFEWLEPKLPPGWTAVRAWDLTQAPVAHVHNSARERDFFQERNIGPPDKNDETERLEQAIARREAKEREEAASAAAAAGGVAPAAIGDAAALRGGASSIAPGAATAMTSQAGAPVMRIEPSAAPNRAASSNPMPAPANPAH